MKVCAHRKAHRSVGGVDRKGIWSAGNWLPHKTRVKNTKSQCRSLRSVGEVQVHIRVHMSVRRLDIWPFGLRLFTANPWCIGHCYPLLSTLTPERIFHAPFMLSAHLVNGATPANGKPANTAADICRASAVKVNDVPNLSPRQYFTYLCMYE